MESTVLSASLLSSLVGDSEIVPFERRRKLGRFAACRTEEMGGFILRCPNCHAGIVHYHPCNARGCPGCAPIHQQRWRAAMAEKLLSMGHFHLVLSGPSMLATKWLTDRRGVTNALFSAANTTFKTVMEHIGLTFGLVIVFQSHGRALSYKPHLHCLLTPGGIDRDGRWVEYTQVNEKLLRQEFEKRMVAAIGHLDGDRWTVYTTFHRDGATGIVSYLSHSIFGLPFDPREPLEVHEQTVRFGEWHHGRRQDRTIRRDAFVDRYFAHIPPKGCVTIRHYRVYSNRYRAVLERLRSVMPEQNQPPTSDADEESLVSDCPVCNHRLEIERVFTVTTLPNELVMHRRIRGSPYHHEEIILPIDSPMTRITSTAATTPKGCSPFR